jgi:hypothetical protein
VVVETEPVDSVDKGSARATALQAELVRGEELAGFEESEQSSMAECRTRSAAAIPEIAAHQTAAEKLACAGVAGEAAAEVSVTPYQRLADELERTRADRPAEQPPIETAGDCGSGKRRVDGTKDPQDLLEHALDDQADREDY